MSTILNALHKQATNQVCNITAKETNKYWKVGLLSALLMVVFLLCVLIFILVNPARLSALKAAQAEPEPVIPAALAPSLSAYPVQLKEVGKIHFQTKPLPLSADKKNSQDFASKAFVSTKPIVLSGKKKPLEALSAIDYSNVSDDLAARFKNALAMQGQDMQTERPGEADAEEDSGADDGSDIEQMSRAFQEKVPSISYDFHMYSTVAEDRWIRLNGEELKEGQFTSSGEIQVVEIQPNRTIFRLGNQSFSIESLTDWQGL